MADQKTGDAAISGLVKTYYDRLMIESTFPRTRFYESSEKRPLPKGTGKTIEFTGYKRISTVVSNMTELTVPAQLYLSAYTLQASIIQRGGYLQLSDILVLTSIDPRVESAIEELSDDGARTVDFFIRSKLIGIGYATRSSVDNLTPGVGNNFSIDTNNALTAGSSQPFHRIYSDYPILNNKARLATSASLTDTVAGSSMTLATVRDTITYLKMRNVKPFADGYYRAIMHTKQVEQIRGGANWQHWYQYIDNTVMLKGEVGRVEQCRILEANTAFRYVYSGTPWTTASGACNGAFVFGRQAYACSEIEGTNGPKGFEIYVKTPGPHTTNDPVNQKNTIGFKITMACEPLNKSNGVWVLTSDKATSGGL